MNSGNGCINKYILSQCGVEKKKKKRKAKHLNDSEDENECSADENDDEEELGSQDSLNEFVVGDHDSESDYGDLETQSTEPYYGSFGGDDYQYAESGGIKPFDAEVQTNEPYREVYPLKITPMTGAEKVALEFNAEKTDSRPPVNFRAANTFFPTRPTIDSLKTISEKANSDPIPITQESTIMMPEETPEKTTKSTDAIKESLQNEPMIDMIDEDKMIQLKNGKHGGKGYRNRHGWVISWFGVPEIKPTFDEERMTYLIFAPERTSSTKGNNLFHWQTYVAMKSGMTLKAFVTYINKLWKGGENGTKKMGAHIAKASAQASKTYICGPYENVKSGKKKERNAEFEEYGIMPMDNGQKRSLVEAKNDILDGNTNTTDLILDDIGCLSMHQYGRILEKIQAIKNDRNPRTEFTKVKWYYGPTGTGKSHTVFEKYQKAVDEGNGKDWYHWTPDGKGDEAWWDGFTAEHKHVIINELRPGQFSQGFFLKMIDKFPFKVRTRGRDPIQFKAEWVYITSPYSPSKMWQSTYEADKEDIDSYEQVERRFQNEGCEIIELTKRYVEPTNLLEPKKIIIL